MTVTRLTYRAFGLCWDSDFEVPALGSALGSTVRAEQVGANESVVRVRAGAVTQPGTLVASRVAIGVGGEAIFEVAGAGRLFVGSASDVLVDLSEEADHDLLGLVLAGPVAAEVLARAGHLVVHGSAVATPSGAVVFVGPPSVGASTLAAALSTHGYPLLSDDVVAIRVDEFGESFVPPGRQLLQLHADSYRLVAGDKPLGALRDSLERYWWVPEHMAAGELPLRAIYVMEHTNLDEGSVVRNDAWDVGPRLMSRRWNQAVAAACGRSRKDRLWASAIEVSTPTAKIRNARSPGFAVQLAQVIARDLASEEF